MTREEIAQALLKTGPQAPMGVAGPHDPRWFGNQGAYGMMFDTADRIIQREKETGKNIPHTVSPIYQQLTPSNVNPDYVPDERGTSPSGWNRVADLDKRKPPHLPILPNWSPGHGRQPDLVPARPFNGTPINPRVPGPMPPFGERLGGMLVDQPPPILGGMLEDLPPVMRRAGYR
jgi:hypothetical protein